MLDPLFNPLVLLNGREPVGDFRPEHLCHPAGGIAPAQVIIQFVPGDGPDPRRERTAPVMTVQVRMHGDKHFLGKILGRVMIAQMRGQKGPHGGSLLPDEPAEGVAVAGADALQDFHGKRRGRAGEGK